MLLTAFLSFMSFILVHFPFHQDTIDLGNTWIHIIQKGKSVECPLRDSVSCSALHAHYLQRAHSLHRRTNLWGSGGGIKFTPNDNPSLTSPEETNGAPRWCFNITNYLGVLGKGTDVALRMRKGWGAGQGHHTPRLGSDKHGWLGVLACPAAIKRETRTETQELWIERYSAEGLRGGWGQGRGGSPLSYAWVIQLACAGLRGRALAKNN